MAIEVYLGNPPENIKTWIRDHFQPASHEETWYKYDGDTEWRTTMLSGEIALVNSDEDPTGQIDNPKDIVAIEIGTGTQANPVTSIGSYAFYYCTNLTSTTIPNSVTSIWDYAFTSCAGLTRMTIGNGVTRIESSAFDGCSGLTSVTIPNSVTEIWDYAFSYCSRLTSVTIPNSVTSIGTEVFRNCTSLTSVTFDCFDISTAKSQITNNSIFGEVFYDPITWEPIEKTFSVTCTDGSFNVTFGTDGSITFTDL